MVLTIVKPGSARSAATPPNRTIDAVSEMGGRSARTTSPSPTSVTVTDRTAWSMSRSAAVDRPLDRRDHQVIDDAERGHGRGNCPGAARSGAMPEVPESTSRIPASAVVALRRVMTTSSPRAARRAR